MRASPTRSKTLKKQPTVQPDNSSFASNIDKELVKGLTEAEVEIDHLKTTIIALNEKVEVIIFVF